MATVSIPRNELPRVHMHTTPNCFWCCAQIHHERKHNRHALSPLSLSTPQIHFRQEGTVGCASKHWHAIRHYVNLKKEEGKKKRKRKETSTVSFVVRTAMPGVGFSTPGAMTPGTTRTPRSTCTNPLLHHCGREIQWYWRSEMSNISALFLFPLFPFSFSFFPHLLFSLSFETTPCCRAHGPSNHPPCQGFMHETGKQFRISLCRVHRQCSLQ